MICTTTPFKQKQCKIKLLQENISCTYYVERYIACKVFVSSGFHYSKIYMSIYLMRKCANDYPSLCTNTALYRISHKH